MLRKWVVNFLSRPIAHYEQRSWLDVRALERSIQKGDVLLVEGDQRVSTAIKYLTQSTWSHAALYLGDELLRQGEEVKARALEEFGADADSLLVEALMDGVVLSPLSKYYSFNLRVCRPHGLRSEHRQEILNEAIDAVGAHYDLRNIIQLLIYFLPVEFLKRRLSMATGRAIGAELPTEVMCTSLIGHLFQRVGFPVLPEVTFPARDPIELYSPRQWWQGALRRREPRYSALFRQTCPRLLAPRDFDLSSYFDIVKFNVIEKGRFDYTRIRWVEPSADGVQEAEEEQSA